MNALDFPLLIYIILFTFIGSIFSLVGGLLLLWKRSITERISHLLISFAAGALIATAFFDLLPEASAEAKLEVVLAFALLGFLGFFILERFIHWIHPHPHEEKKERRSIPLIIIGGNLHKLMDGMAIAATFLVSIPLGIITSCAIAFHEIPREIGDFAVMIGRSYKSQRVIFLNLIGAISAVLGAVLVYFFGRAFVSFLPFLLAITGGFFIYISASALIPEIHEKNKRGFAFIETIFLLFGVFIVWLLVKLLE